MRCIPINAPGKYECRIFALDSLTPTGRNDSRALMRLLAFASNRGLTVTLEPPSSAAFERRFPYVFASIERPER